ncbi:protein UsfY [Mycobacterium sp. 1465703.0]|uniref:protein UsfY n=1 Tax=Mycobacterium sp. 1465703.0 TaxID=1834078 RepID=UPI0007FC3696|nr:protein UsfY [Mycobacterium sp. 1465703.0]OBJ07166.1 UsfY protein [Mycobacterium sp. 1465703.0]
MGDRHHDPTDHFRTTQPRAGLTMKDNLLWPGFVLLAVAVGGTISALAVAAYGHDEWLVRTVLVAVLGLVAATLWFVAELRRVSRIDEQWLRQRRRRIRRERAASSEPSRNVIRDPSASNV